MKQVIRIGTRKSKLAMVQTNMVVEALKDRYPGLKTEVIPMSTMGDKILNKSLESFGGKGAFVTEFEEAMLSDKIDIAVHSAKDMPIVIPEELAILGVLKREDPRDVLVTLKGREKLSADSILGSSSLRRQILIQEQYKVQVTNLRGNVITRLNKLKAGEYDGILLAAAGLKRLELLEDEELSYTYLDTDTFIPAAGQGIIVIEGKKEDSFLELLKPINDLEAFCCLETEREVIKLLQTGCSDPVGAFATVSKKDINLSVFYVYKDKIIKVRGNAPVKNRLELAKDLVISVKEKLQLNQDETL